VSALTELRDVTLSWWELRGPHTLRPLAASAPHLRRLDLAELYGIDADNLRMLSQMEQLHELVLPRKVSWSQVLLPNHRLRLRKVAVHSAENTQEDYDALITIAATLTDVRLIDLAELGGAFLSAVAPRLQRLTLALVETADAKGVLITALQQCTQLTRLELHHCPVAALDCLRDMSQLRYLSLSYCVLPCVPPRQRAVLSFLRSAAFAPTLQHLRLDDCGTPLTHEEQLRTWGLHGYTAGKLFHGELDNLRPLRALRSFYSTATFAHGEWPPPTFWDPPSPASVAAAAAAGRQLYPTEDRLPLLKHFDVEGPFHHKCGNAIQGHFNAIYQ